MQKSTKALEPFTTNSWNWSNKNVVALEKELDKEDRQVFSFNIKEEFHWQEYLVIYVQVLLNKLLKNVTGMSKMRFWHSNPINLCKQPTATTPTTILGLNCGRIVVIWPQF